jgi:hypothetical protein
LAYEEKRKRRKISRIIIEYQDKMYLPGYYVGGKIHPALKAKTKVGGYLMLASGIFLLVIYLIQTIMNFSIENISMIIPIGFAILLVIVGCKFIKINKNLDSKSM